MITRRWSAEEVRELGVVTDLLIAAEVLGIGRTAAYALAKRGEFPVRVIRAGVRYMVPVQGLLNLLEIQEGFE